MEQKALSKMADSLQGSEIIKLAGEIRELVAGGKKVNNLTIGDFDPNLYPIPTKLKQEIVEAYNNNETNYPPANGIAELRNEVSTFVQEHLNATFTPDQVLVSGGSRPLIYAFYTAVCDPGDKVVFPTPSWNNNHYSHLTDCEQIAIKTTPENNFMPKAEDIKPHIGTMNLLALCSPQNPTGTVFGKEQLTEICKLLVAENKKRASENRKPIYVLFDHIYWTLMHGKTEHFIPDNLVPEIAPYTVYIDGISKGFAATGVRVGFAYGAQHIINKMRSILSHIGAWSPKAEQVATAKFLADKVAVNEYLTTFKTRLNDSLVAFYKGISDLKNEGFSVSAIEPQAAIYLTVQFDLVGKTNSKTGEKLENINDVTAYLLHEANLGIVPFKCFGTEENSNWYRISVGTVSAENVPSVINDLRTALAALK